jgi:hypothetical protein
MKSQSNPAAQEGQPPKLPFVFDPWSGKHHRAEAVGSGRERLEAETQSSTEIVVATNITLPHRKR